MLLYFTDNFAGVALMGEMGGGGGYLNPMFYHITCQRLWVLFETEDFL